MSLDIDKYPWVEKNHPSLKLLVDDKRLIPVYTGWWDHCLDQDWFRNGAQVNLSVKETQSLQTSRIQARQKLSKGLQYQNFIMRQPSVREGRASILLRVRKKEERKDGEVMVKLDLEAELNWEFKVETIPLSLGLSGARPITQSIQALPSGALWVPYKGLGGYLMMKSVLATISECPILSWVDSWFYLRRLAGCYNCTFPTIGGLWRFIGNPFREECLRPRMLFMLCFV